MDAEKLWEMGLPKTKFYEAEAIWIRAKQPQSMYPPVSRRLVRLADAMRDELLHRLEAETKRADELEAETAATVCRLTAEIDDYADRLAAAEQELGALHSVYRELTGKGWNWQPRPRTEES
jgi:hypothetical protein